MGFWDCWAQRRLSGQPLPSYATSCYGMGDREQTPVTVKPLTHDPSRRPVMTGRRFGRHDGRYFWQPSWRPSRRPSRLVVWQGMPSRRPSRRLRKDYARRNGSHDGPSRRPVTTGRVSGALKTAVYCVNLSVQLLAYAYTEWIQELIRRWDSEREPLRSAPGSYRNSPK